MNEAPTSAAERLRAPAIALIAYGILATLIQLVSLVNELLGHPLEKSLFEFLRERGVEVPDFDPETLTGGLLFGASLAMNIVMGALTLALALFSVWGGLQMLRRRHHAACLAAAIAACLPCGACCCLGLPLGIWALVVLNRPDVRAAVASC